jgi:hypothetical protein
MTEIKNITSEKQNQKDSNKFSEVNEYNHGRNPVAKAQKQSASQETTGLLDQQ